MSEQQTSGDPFVSLRLPRERIEALTRLARSRGCDRSALIRTILTDYLDEHGDRTAAVAGKGERRE